MHERRDLPGRRTLARWRALWLALFLSAVAFPLCAAPSRGPLVLKVYRLPDARSGTAPAVAEEEVVKAFLKRFPNIKLVSPTGLTIEGVTDSSKTLLSIAGGLSPDVIQVTLSNSDTYITQGFLQPLDRFIPESATQEIEERVPAAVMPVIHRKGPDGQTHYWALPSNIMVRVLMYRKDLFMDAGIEHPPRDWKELEEDARLLTRPEKGVYGFGSGKGPLLAQDWLLFLWTAGGEAVAQDSRGDWRATFDSDAAVEAMLQFVHMFTRPWPDPETGKIRNGYVLWETGWWDLAQKWKDGKVGMLPAFVNQHALGTRIIRSAMDIAPFPAGPTGHRAAQIDCEMMGLFAGIEPRDGYSVEEIQAAAWDYIWFYNSDEANRIRTEVFVRFGDGRLVNPIYLKKYGYDQYLSQVPKSWLPVFEDAMKHGRPSPYGKNCQMILEFMKRPIEDCVDLERKGKLGRDDAERRANIRKILQSHVARTDAEMIGAISPQERRKRNNVALAVGICMVAAFTFLLHRVWKSFTFTDAYDRERWGFRKYAMAYIILIPALASILLWNYYPMFRGTIMAFQDYRIVGQSKFVGLQNLADVLWDPTWWQSLARTLYYMLLLLGLGFWTPIVLALLLTEVSRGKVIYRTLFYLPAVMSGMVVIYLWKLMYDPSDHGLFNLLLGKLGLPTARWLDDTRLAMICCVLPTIWAGMGSGCLLYLAALKSVPDDLYEAADIDGCGFFGKIWHITLPRIKALIVINFIGAFIAASQNTGLILVLTFGGPREATKVAGLHIYEKAYLLLRFGSAVTMAWMLGTMMLCFTTMQLKRLSRMEFRADGRAGSEPPAR